MKTIKLFFLAALLCGVANTVAWAALDACELTPAPGPSSGPVEIRSSHKDAVNFRCSGCVNAAVVCVTRKATDTTGKTVEVKDCGTFKVLRSTKISVAGFDKDGKSVCETRDAAYTVYGSKPGAVVRTAGGVSVTAQRPGVEITPTPDGGVTITVHHTSHDDKGKVVRKATSAQLRQRQFKTRRYVDGNEWEEEIVNKRRCTEREPDGRCKTYENKSYSPLEEIEATEARAKAHTDAAAAAVELPMFSRTRPGEIVSEQMLAQVVCPANQMVRKPDGSYQCLAERTELYSPAAQIEAQADEIRRLSSKVADVRKSAVLQPQRQAYELMLGAGATGVMDLGGALVAVGDMVWGSDRWPLGLVLHGEFGDMSDGQGFYGCAEAGLVKPMPGTTTTVGMLGGWCGSQNADLNGANFWHASLQVRHRVLRDWLALGADLKGGALWAERVVNQTVREVRDPAAGLTFVAQIKFF